MNDMRRIINLTESTTGDPIQAMAQLAHELHMVVSKMAVLYDQHYELIQDIQPDSTKQAFASSLDEWRADLAGYDQDWQRIVEDGGQIFIHLYFGDQTVPEVTTTLQSFFKENDMDSDEQTEIKDALRAHREYSGGGGASAEWTIKLAVA
jgi:hypothetical protein